MKRHWILLLFLAGQAHAAVPEIEVHLRDHLFYPEMIEVPVGVKVRLMIVNEDDTPEEFESYALNREKVIPAKSHTVVFIGPLKSGEYVFIGEFNARTAQGRVVVK